MKTMGRLPPPLSRRACTEPYAAASCSRGCSGAAAAPGFGVNGRLTGHAVVVAGICCAVGGAILVARGVGFVFWLILALAAAVLIAAVVSRIAPELFSDLSLAPLADRYRDWRSGPEEAQWLSSQLGEPPERRRRMRATAGEEEG
jgi:hypothetical protein